VKSASEAAKRLTGTVHADLRLRALFSPPGRSRHGP
jgi:hypothetical protein